MSNELSIIEVCVDCYMANANGYGELDLTPEREAEIEAGFGKWSGYMMWNRDTDPHFVRHSRCEVCNSPLGGLRYELGAVEK